ncbi:Cytochrome c oxidase subunit 6B [Coccidioides immitis]|nr:Cytochrome c oxidase subunit 6B [Coccidioides immitis]
MWEIPDADPEEPVETKPFKFVTGMLNVPLPKPPGDCKKPVLIDDNTAGFDARFPNQNQTKHCWQNYVDYHKCILAKGEDFKPCRQFFLAYRSLCPKSWTDRWDDQRDAGNFPVRLDR